MMMVYLLQVTEAASKSHKDHPCPDSPMIIQRNSGTFTSPNYPQAPIMTSYSSRKFITCEYIIQVEVGRGIQLQFGDFNIDGKVDDCDEGSVEIFSGTGKHRKNMDKYCPQNNPPTLTLDGNTGTIVLKIPTNFNGRGFLISFIATNIGESVNNFISCLDTFKDTKADRETFRVVCPSQCNGKYRERKEEQEINKLIKKQVIGWQYSTGYQKDSSICLSAVHAGIISDSFGGIVQIEEKAFNSQYIIYDNKLANGIKSNPGSTSVDDATYKFTSFTKKSENIEMTSSMFTASSYWIKKNESPDKFSPRQGLLNPNTGERTLNAWSPQNATNNQEYLQVDLMKIWNITEIVTKCGNFQIQKDKHRLPYGVDTYRISSSIDGKNWEFYKENGLNDEKLFTGNTGDLFHDSRNNFIESTIIARYLRVYPSPASTKMKRYSIKFYLKGRNVNSDFPTPPPLTTTTQTTTTTTTLATTEPTTKPTTTTIKPTTVTTVPSTTTTTVTTKTVKFVPTPVVKGEY